MNSRFYSIHGIVNFKINIDSNVINRHLLDAYKKYENFEVAPFEDPDIEFLIGKYRSMSTDNVILDDLYYIHDGYLSCKKTSYKSAKWAFEISNLDEKPIIVKISHNLIGSMFISGNLIDQFLQYVLNSKGYPIIHSSSVSKDGNAFLFPARSGGGKTTIALNLIEHGFDFMGDNFVILHNGRVLNYLSSLSIFTYNLAPALKKRLKVKDNLFLGLKSLLYKASLGYVKIFSKFNPVEFTDRIEDNAKISKIFLIIPKTTFKVEKISKDDCVRHLIYNQKFEFTLFEKHFLEYSTLFPDSKFATHWQRYLENLKINLPDECPYYKIEVPLKYDKKTFDEIISLVENG